MFPFINFPPQDHLFPSKRRAVNNVVLGALFVVLLWLLWALDDGPCFVPKHLRKYLLFPEDYEIPEEQLGETERKQLALEIERLNSQAEVFNWERYHPVYPDTPVIVITVDKDVERLQYLIISLGQVRYIWRVLLIFSHSYYDEGINYYIKRIKFCKVMQIFYPFSLQLYPGRYPEADPSEGNVTAAAQSNARRAQSKLHWWWSASYVFEGEWGLENRIIMFLGEDDYVLPDFLYVAQLTWRELSAISTVDVVSLGGPMQRLDYSLIKIDTWTPAYSRGLALTAHTWWKISQRTSSFCFHDDYRWSQSLVPVFANFSGGFAQMAASVAPRVLPMNKSMSARRGARLAASVARRARLFPLRIRATVTVGFQRRSLPQPLPSGGWDDLQDQMLCLDPLMKDSTEAPIDTTLPTKDEIKNLLWIK